MSQAANPNTTSSTAVSAGKSGTVNAGANRRELLASICGAAAAASICAAPALAATGADPIYAAIETHRLAQAALFAACEVSGKMLWDDPGADAANTVTVTAMEAFEAAQTSLTDVPPTTLAGVVALLVYIDEFNRGVHFNSEHHLWSADEYGDDSVLTVKGHPLHMPFPFWIMRNVQAALLAIATA